MTRAILVGMILPLIVYNCRKPNIIDHSLSLSEYRNLGMPDCDKDWTFENFDKALTVLLKIKREKPYSLPRKGSEKSGMVFDRMVSLDNTSFLQIDTVPLSIKARQINEFLRVQDNWIDLYTNIRMKKQFYHRELLDLQIFGLTVAQKMLDLANKIQQSEVPGDIEMQSGFSSIRGLYTIYLFDALKAQKFTSEYFVEDLERLSDTIANAVLRNQSWMDNAVTQDLNKLITTVIDSTSSDYIKEKYSTLRTSLLDRN